MFVAIALLLSCYLSLASAIPFQRRTSYPGVITKCTVPNTVALTFDDGPYYYLKDVVKTLKDANAKGTFFFNGHNWDCIYSEDMVARVKLAYDSGFQVASHTWSHPRLTQLNESQVDTEMARSEDAIYKITGARVAFTRPPYGEYNDVTLKVACARNQQLINWDFDSGDSTGVKPEDQKKLYDDVVKNKPSTLLSLEHEVFNTSVYEVLPYAVKVLQGAGYNLVTVAECLGQAPYHSVGAPSPRDSSWYC